MVIFNLALSLYDGHLRLSYTPNSENRDLISSNGNFCNRSRTSLAKLFLKVKLHEHFHLQFTKVYFTGQPEIMRKLFLIILSVALLQSATCGAHRRNRRGRDRQQEGEEKIMTGNDGMGSVWPKPKSMSSTNQVRKNFITF